MSYPLSQGLVAASLALSLAFAQAAVYADFRAQAFHPAHATNDAVSAPPADPDRDGLPNFAEHALGLDPLQPDRDRALRWSWDGSGLLLYFEQALAAHDANMHVQWAPDPAGPWSPLTPDTVDHGAATRLLRARTTASPAQPIAFLRLDAAEVAPPPATPAWVWFEAESAGGETSPELSNNAMVWVSPGGSIQKTVNVPAAGSYHLWVRKFWNPQAIRWRVGAAAPWNESPSPTLSDLLILGGNAGRRVGWANLGPVTLTPGNHIFRLEVLAGDSNTTAYDCFLLTREPFTPRGKLKPDQQPQINQPGWFAFQPAPDPFAFSPIDLRHLNERQAGEHGFIRARDESFIHENTGQPARFWAVNVGMGFVGSARAELDRFARSMAKRGVNLVRVHGPVYTTSGAAFGQIDTNRLAQLHYFIHALKREGIYTALSIYFPLWVTLGPENTNLPGYPSGQHPFAIQYFNPAFQTLFRSWWHAVLTTPNPHTGLAPKDDPAVAFAELYNEDSTLFWTFNPDAGPNGNLPDPQRALLEKQFGDWLLARYPGQSLAQIKSARWANVGSPHDNFAAGRVGFRGLWNIANDRNRRDQDTARFLTELMLDFHRANYAYLKNDLGYRGLVCCSNWKTASAQYLDPLDKYANSVADFFDRHGYFGGLHDGPNASWNIENNQTYDDRSALRFRSADGTQDDFTNPIFDLVYQRQPSVISEINWPLPNRYRADMIPLGAAYAALQGTDAVYWFAAGSPAWEGLPGKFSIQTPVALGQFPAAALIYRLGLVQTAPRVVDLQLAVPNLYALQGTPLPAPQNFDQLRGDDIPPGGTLTNVSALDSLAFLVGRTGIDFITNGTPQSQVVDLSPYIDRAAKTVRSHTGELEWQWGAGLLKIAAPSAQGVAGFLAPAGRLDLPDVSLESPLDYGSILVVSLDGQPLASSAKLLVQVASEELPHEWATSPSAGRRTLTNRGTVPLLVRQFAGSVRLRRPDAAALSVTPLDYNGYRLPASFPHADTIALRPETPYYLIEK